MKPGLWAVRLDGVADVQKSCFTRELLDANPSELAAKRLPEGVTCEHNITEQSPTATVSRTACTGPFAIEGTTRMEVHSSESMSMTSTTLITLSGQRQSMTVKAQYTWLSSDCGSVKPIGIGSSEGDSGQ